MSLEILHDLMAKKWQGINQNNKLIALINSGLSDRKIFCLYMAETYHYASHNAKNQALVVQQLKSNQSRDINYMKFCLEHASEETGHELMAYHDLKAAGLKVPLNELPHPLPATETFIAYLYYISQNGNPVRRLGYSFWAENSYRFFAETMMKAAQNMKLNKSMMTFYSEHSDIDEKHAEDVERILKLVCKTDEDWKSVAEVMEQTLDLTATMLDSIALEYQKVINNQSVWNKIFTQYGEEQN